MSQPIAFNLTTEHEKKAHAVIDEMEKESRSVAELSNVPFKLYIVKDGTQDAQERKDTPDAIFGKIQYKEAQYLITAK